MADLESNVLALQAAQVNSALEHKKHISTLEKSMAQLLQNMNQLMAANSAQTAPAPAPSHAQPTQAQYPRMEIRDSMEPISFDS